MKKLLSKIRRKKTEEGPTRITNDTIAEHRERILAGGRRFKYPVQYARHRLVINAIIVAVSAVILLVGVLWWQLYLVQNSSDLIYRITRVVPVPVASVDGTWVSYSDYLMKYRSSLHYLTEKEQINLKEDGGQRQADHVKQESIRDAIQDAYARKLAADKGISVTDAEVQVFIDKQRKSGTSEVSESTYNAVILDYYGWSPQEYEEATRGKLLLQKVKYAVDDQALATSKSIKAGVDGGQTNLKKLAGELNKSAKTRVQYGVSGIIPADNQDGGLAAAASGLKQGAISAVIQPTTGEGYYVIKLVKKTVDTVSYEYIHVTLTKFDTALAQLKKDDKVSTYITVPTSDSTTSK